MGFIRNRLASTARLPACNKSSHLGTLPSCATSTVRAQRPRDRLALILCSLQFEWQTNCLLVLHHVSLFQTDRLRSLVMGNAQYSHMSAQQEVVVSSSRGGLTCEEIVDYALYFIPGDCSLGSALLIHTQSGCGGWVVALQLGVA